VNSATVTSRGQITIPMEIRNHLGLKEGDRLAFINDGGEIILRLNRGRKNPFAAYAGALASIKGGTKEVNTWVAELRDEA
jgi:AbrB family looped-hinge helix DNA binding protein